MITLTLLHPTQSIPVQSWSFESESVVRIGRSNDNDVIIYSAVVSRHHLELWNNPSGWEIINFGANGTYVDDKPIVQVSVVDGMTIRLGNSGPKIRIRVVGGEVETRKKMLATKRSPMSQKSGSETGKQSLTPQRSMVSTEETVIYTDEEVTQTDFN